MIKWKRIEAGDYYSEDERWHIVRGWDRIYGDHWILCDTHGDYYRDSYDFDSLKQCKYVAENLEREEKKNNKV